MNSSNTEHQMIDILCKWQSGSVLSRDERSLLNNWFIQHKDELTGELDEQELKKIARYRREVAATWEQFKATYNPPARIYPMKASAPIPRTRRVWPHVAGTLAALLVIGLGIWFVIAQMNSAKKNDVASLPAINEIWPGVYKASLKLSNGLIIKLDGKSSRQIATNYDVTIYQQPKAKLIYQSSKVVQSRGHIITGRQGVDSNALITNLGEKYTVYLSDGSRITLNAGSQLQYPPVFTGKERSVVFSGEGDFDVVNDPSKPFIVHMINDKAIKVLGTHFNIQAYADEPVAKVTLLTGKIQIRLKKDSLVLRPNQQAVIDTEKAIEATNADLTTVNEAMAWTTDSIYSENISVREVMKQLSRWYSIEVVFKDPEVANIRIKLAPISITQPLTKVLSLIQQTTVLHYQIDGRKVTIMK